ncbi:WD repeat-containing protein 46-like [Cetorhinus maximus]
MAAEQNLNRKRFREGDQKTSADVAPAELEERNLAKLTRNSVTPNPQRAGLKRRAMSRDPKKRLLSGKEDPFPGPAPIPEEAVRKFQRGEHVKLGEIANQTVKNRLRTLDKVHKLAQKQAARFDLLLPEDAGFLEADEGEDTCLIQQQDIADAVDITSSSKVSVEWN